MPHTNNKEVQEFAKDLSAKVRWASGYGQYENDSKEQQAYIDGVTTAIGMMYIDLTGSPKTEGMLVTFLHQELQKAREEERRRIRQNFKALCTVNNDGDCKYFKDELHTDLLDGAKFIPQHIINEILAPTTDQSELDQPK